MIKTAGYNLNRKGFTTAQIAALMAILTGGTKLLGFIREMVLASYYGASEITDAYNMAQSIPNILLTGIVSSVGIAYMPILSQKIEQDGVDIGDLFTSRLLNAISVVLLVAIIIGISCVHPLVNFFAPGFHGVQADLTVWYLKWAFFSVLFTAFIYIFEAYLQYHGVFTPQIVLTYFQSLSVILIIIISARINYSVLILGPFIGYVIRSVGCLLLAKRKGFHYSPDFKSGGAVKETILLALPVFIGSSVAQINTFVDRMLASSLPKGSISALTYSNEIINAIVMLTVTILVTILYPRLNQAFALGNYETIGSLTERGINLIALVAVPFSIGSMVYAVPVIRIIYEHGAFTAENTNATASAFFCYSIGLAFLAVNQLITKVFYSFHDTRTAVYCSIISVVSNIILNLFLVRYFSHAGLALATSIAQIINASLLYFAFKYKYKSIILMRSKKKIALIILFTLISIAISYFNYELLKNVLHAADFFCLFIAVISAVGIYLVMLIIAKFEELNILKSLINRK